MQYDFLNKGHGTQADRNKNASLTNMGDKMENLGLKCTIFEVKENPVKGF